ENTSVALSPDASALSIIFDNYSAEAGKQSPGRKQSDSSQCLVYIMMKLPAGVSIGIARADYRGFISLPAKGNGEVSASLGFLHQPYYLASNHMKQRFTGPIDENFQLSQKIKSPLWSKCGGNVYLMLQSSLKVKSNSHREQALAIIDSLDISHEQGATYEIVKRRCNNKIHR
ncbi:MAG: DUF4360 domain-containing protein, partial [Bdellovibrionota bacterium]